MTLKKTGSFELRFDPELDQLERFKLTRATDTQVLETAKQLRFTPERSPEKDVMLLVKAERDHLLKIYVFKKEPALVCKVIAPRGDFPALRRYYKNLEFDGDQFLNGLGDLDNGGKDENDDSGPPPMHQ
ncbi:MAG: hypothetical protein HY556_12290 [Euryarchaeota archaeon]|nr:hypothetical protein [Euryarchaeota archaeon]